MSPGRAQRPRRRGPSIPPAIAALARDLEEQQMRLELQNQAMLQSQLELELSRERYAEFYDSAPVCFISLSPSGLICDLNLPAAEFFGQERRRLVGYPFSRLLAPAARRRFATHFARCRRSPAPAGRSAIELELSAPREGEGEGRFIELMSVPQPRHHAGAAVFHSVIIDVTERHGLQERRELDERELKAARDAAERASQAKDDFLAVLSHELRTPLNPVLLVASEAAADPSLPPGIRERFELVRRNTELEARLIDDMLDLTRITRGKLMLEKRPVRIHAVLEQALATVWPEIRHKGIRIEKAFAAPHDLVLGESIRLQQVFWNILKNAVKFTPADGAVSVSTALGRGGDTLSIFLSDTGIGMSGAEIEQVFEPFAQGDHAGGGGRHRFGGLGLGLSISRKLAEAHGGTIAASSAGRGKGATFEVCLPLAPADQADGYCAPEAPAAAPTGPAAHPRILLVEDHEPTRTTLATLLGRRGYEVRAAACAQEARTLAESEPFQLLITDIGLPDASGYELFAEVSRHGPIRGIALTGYGMEGDLARSEAAGFEQHLTKPVTFQALERALAAVAAAPAG